MTTFMNYGSVAVGRQVEIIQRMASSLPDNDDEVIDDAWDAGEPSSAPSPAQR